MIRKKEPEKPLYRVFFKGTDKPVYLPSGKGVEQEEAERLSKLLVVDTEVKCVFVPEPEED